MIALVVKIVSVGRADSRDKDNSKTASTVPS